MEAIHVNHVFGKIKLLAHSEVFSVAETYAITPPSRRFLKACHRYPDLFNLFLTLGRPLPCEARDCADHEIIKEWHGEI